MKVYLDTSVVLRVLFHEPNPITIWGKWDRAYTSRLLRVEALRTVDRLRLSGDLSDLELADLATEIQTVYETLAIHPLNERILKRASETFPTVLGTLDAIHLATALALREFETLDLILTHDPQLGTAARSLGFSVMGTE
jgi:predicted nucleic acid-binding protein